MKQEVEKLKDEIFKQIRVHYGPMATTILVNFPKAKAFDYTVSLDKVVIGTFRKGVHAGIKYTLEYCKQNKLNFDDIE